MHAELPALKVRQSGPKFDRRSLGGSLLLFLFLVQLAAAQSSHHVPKHNPAQKPAHTSAKKSAAAKPPAKSRRAAAAGSKSTHARRGSGKTTHTRAGRIHVAPTARSIKLTQAFIATTQLRPMAQQLSATRSAAAYAGVQIYAASHPGEPASAAWLAIGHAYTLDHRYPDAVNAFHAAASRGGDVLSDYTDFLGAQAALGAGNPADAYALLDHFADRHPDSIFATNAPILLATTYLGQNDPTSALRVLDPLRATPQATHADFLYALGRAYQLSGNTGQAIATYRTLYTSVPLSSEATQARSQLQTLGTPLSAADRKTHADKLFNAKRYADASAEYHSVSTNDSSLSQADRNALEIYAAVCDLKLKNISRREVERLPSTSDDSAALKLYMLAELSRTEGDRAGHDSTITDLVARFPASRWTEEALYSGGNMYLLRHDSEQAIYHYSQLLKLFPDSTYAPSAHWRVAWMNYRLRRYPEAARLMDEQIARYTAGIEVPAALFWRARIFEDTEGNLPQAGNYYRALSGAYANFYYALLARKRLSVLGKQPEIPPAAVLSAVHAPDVPPLSDLIPENDPHYIKAKLLANAALNEYIGPEIQSSPTAGEWGALAQAQIYDSFGEHTRALQSIKHSGIPFFALPFDEVPIAYWRLLFPQPYWPEILQDAQSNGLDPFLVASLIRQESEFNPEAVSRASAYGLMQLLPSVGKSLAKREGIHGFNTNQLLNPNTNIRLGTLNLRQVLDRFGGQPEYTFAAYNAGDVPVRQWMASGDYKDVPEFVESIPYTETREYVQAILRNREMYRQLTTATH